MHIRGFQVPPFNTLSPAAIQGFIDGLAALGLRHGIIVDMGSLLPAHPGAGGYFVAPGGYLTVSTAEELAEMARVPQQSDTPESRAYIADFARMSGHDRLRIIRDLG